MTTRFPVGGDGDGNQDGPSPKRPRVSDSVISIPTSTAATTSAAAAPQPQVQQIPPAANPVPTFLQSTEKSPENSSSPFSLGFSSSEEWLDEEEDLLQLQTKRDGGRVKFADREPVGSSRSVSITLTDPDVLNCPICYEPLSVPVYQCGNGHAVCASCWKKKNSRCASCCQPIGQKRCRAIEKVLESVRISCKNMPLGCKETFSYDKKLDHEKKCAYASCSCPEIGCSYASMCTFVYVHFSVCHSSKQFCFDQPLSLTVSKDLKHTFLREKIHKTIFILKQSFETVGSFVDVVCVAPPSEKGAYLYTITATIGESSIILKSVADVVTKWLVLSPKKLYLVPSDYINSFGEMKLELRIWKKSKSWLDDI